MARLIPREFDTTKPTFARRAFTANGHKFAPGKAFDWKSMSLSQRKAKTLFDSGHIGHQESAPISVAVAPAPIALEAADELDLIDDMKELRAIAYAEGAAIKVSKADQRQAIRDNRG